MRKKAVTLGIKNNRNIESEISIHDLSVIDEELKRVYPMMQQLCFWELTLQQRGHESTEIYV